MLVDDRDPGDIIDEEIEEEEDRFGENNTLE